MGNLCTISGQAHYTYELKTINLCIALHELRAKRDDVKRKVDRANQQRRRPLSEVQRWLSKTKTVITEAETMIRAQEIEKLCPGGCRSKNCRCGYKFGQQVADKLKEIAELRSGGDFYEVAEEEPDLMQIIFTIPTVGLESTLDEVLNLLEKEQVGMIGLHGLGGVGKTEVLKQINNKLVYNKLSTESNCYDAVILITVFKDHTIENLQLKIWNYIRPSNDESWKNKPSHEKSQDIYRFLSKKRFVLLLDNIWERVDLIKVGVPLPSQQNGSKVVFTTRLSYLCGQMKAKAEIRVSCLGENEAWTLFQQKVGEETLNSHPHIRKLAKKVAAECGGLPLALIVIGQAMIGKKSPQSWEFALNVLINFAHKLNPSFGQGLGQELYSVLKFSYDNLPSDSMRSCLLYCCLFLEDHRIRKSTLIHYWFCEGLLNVFESIIHVHLQGHYIIDFLVSVNLLVQDVNENYVRVHDVIRDMCLWIVCECEAEGNRSFVQAAVHRISLNSDSAKRKMLRNSSGIS